MSTDTRIRHGMAKLFAALAVTLLFLSPLAGATTGGDDASAPDREWIFRVLLDGDEIGYHSFELIDEGERARLRSEASFTVRFLFFDAYKYRHENEEIWRDGCLQANDARTRVNGKSLEVRGERMEEAFVVAADQNDQALADDCVMSFAYWKPEFLGFTKWGQPANGPIKLLDPLSQLMTKQSANQWFMYGFIYTVAVVVMGVRMFFKYRHNRYHLIRTGSVMFFQLGFAFLLPNVSHTEAYISFVFTHPEWRGAGIGKFLIYHLIQVRIETQSFKDHLEGFYCLVKTHDNAVIAHKFSVYNICLSLCVQTCSGKDIVLHVSCNNPAVMLYQRFGFKVEERITDFYDKYLPADSKECRHALFLRLAR